MGLSDQLTEGTWLWNSTGATLVGYANWGSNEPGGGTYENCVAMKSATAGWADFNCGYLFWILCEKVLQTNPRGKCLY